MGIGFYKDAAPTALGGVEWFRKAANQGDPIGQEFLAVAYANGFGADEDPIEACKWLALAGAKEPKLVTTVTEMWKTNHTSFTPEQISAGKLRAEEFSKTNHISPKSIPEIPGLSIFQ